MFRIAGFGLLFFLSVEDWVLRDVRIDWIKDEVMDNAACFLAISVMCLIHSFVRLEITALF